jgi:hypothetical protein
VIELVVGSGEIDDRRWLKWWLSAAIIVIRVVGGGPILPSSTTTLSLAIIPINDNHHTNHLAPFHPHPITNLTTITTTMITSPLITILNATNQILTTVCRYYSLRINIILKSQLNKYIIGLFGSTYF